jgi:hypothetical protein
LNSSELRRFFLVVAPAALAVTLVAVLVATVLKAHVATAPGTGSQASAQDTGAPHIGRDHWHAVYQISVCGVVQPPAPTWEGVGVHTHADGIIHIHPFTPSEEGRGARLVKWFAYGGGLLDDSRMRIPGSRKTWENGQQCPDGSEGVLQVSVNDRALFDWSEYIPQDGDRVVIDFGPLPVY